MPGMQVTQIDHVSVIITDVERSRRFYRDLLGLREIHKPRTFDVVVVWFDLGKQHLQDYFASGKFERASGITLDPKRTHVFLCGNPDMVGLPIHGSRALRKPGMVEILTHRGFELQSADRRGNLHCESYW